MTPVWKNWHVDKKITDAIENYEPAELNTSLEHFYAEVNNQKGEDYEPESLKVMMASVERHLKNKGCTLSVPSAQTLLGKYQRRKKKFSGTAENSEVIIQNL